MMETSTYLDGKMIAASKNWVNVISHREKTHGTREVMVGKDKVTWCKEYYGIDCDVHVAGAGAAGRFSGVRGVPCTIFCDPDGNELSRKEGGLAAAELIKEMNAVMAKVPGDHISGVEWNNAKKTLKDAEEKLEKGEFKKAIELEAKIAKHKIKALAALAADTAKLIEDKGMAMIEEAKGKVDSDKAGAKKTLQKIADDFKGLDCAKKALEVLETLKDAK